MAHLTSSTSIPLYHGIPVVEHWCNSLSSCSSHIFDVLLWQEQPRRYLHAITRNPNRIWYIIKPYLHVNNGWLPYIFLLYFHNTSVLSHKRSKSNHKLVEFYHSVSRLLNKHMFNNWKMAKYSSYHSICLNNQTLAIKKNMP